MRRLRACAGCTHHGMQLRSEDLGCGQATQVQGQWRGLQQSTMQRVLPALDQAVEDVEGARCQQDCGRRVLHVVS